MVPAAELARALHRMPPRHAQVLGVRCLEGRGRAEAAAHYRVPAQSYDLLLLRAARDLGAALEGAPPPRPDPFGVEASAAQALREHLEHPPPAAPAPEPLARALDALRSQGPEVRRELERLEAQDAASPARRRETHLRRAAVVAVLALTAWFLWQERLREANRPRFEPRPTAPQTSP